MSPSRKIYLLRKKLRRLRQKEKRQKVQEEEAAREAEIWKRRREVRL